MMKKSDRPNSTKERTVIALLLALLPLLPPLLDLWSAPGKGWFGPYLLWGAIIAAAFFLQRCTRQDAGD